MGPQRDNIWRESGIVDKFPAGGPKVVWRAKVAGGYAGPAVVGNRVYVTDYVTKSDVKVDNFKRKEFTGSERVLCLDAATGKEVWKHEYPVTYGISYPAGPRCTPTVADGKVYTLGAEGNLFCFDAEKGSVIWKKDFKTEYKTKSALWGYASHPLIDGDKLLCVVGGEGSHAVAFDRNTGKELWRAETAKEQGYSPPTIITAGGARQWVLLTPEAVTSVDPATGKQYWTVPYDATSGSIIMSPVVVGEHLYVGGYSNKNLLLKLASDKPGVDIVWRDKRNHGLSPVNVQPFVADGLIYGFDQDGTLHAVEIPSGKRLWSTVKPIGGTKPVGSGTAMINRNGDRYFLFNENGELVIAKMSPAGYEEIDRCKLLEPTNNAFGRKVLWCAPAYAGKRLYVRDDAECICVDLSK
ncbi:MAG: PQQ-binding-like beta-propeller repeat protein [Gemmataceae bacterium]|nr:PQQ-binding-like beta-propeller repeat protein [Gemmataceae bacterium]